MPLAPSPADARLPRGAAVLGLLLLAACGQPKVPARPAVVDEVSRNPDAFVAAVARARGLPVRARVPILIDDDAAFGRALIAKEKSDALPHLGGATLGFYLAFGFPIAKRAPAAPGPATSNPMADPLVDEQLLGFYDEGTRTIHVRAAKLSRGKDDAEIRFLLAHEVEHALAHQSFGAVDGKSLTDDDVLLARFALLEGDASVAALSHLAARGNKPLRRVLARMSEYVRDGSEERMAVSDPGSRALREAPANERERLLFPYTRGLAFASDLYRAGGFTLLDRSFGRAPVSTEQILHPDKYLAGELPIDVAAPAPPAGWARPVVGRMGELQTRVVLAQCMPEAEANEASQGWGGDAYAITAKEDGSVAVLWSTVWDDEPAAKRFADTVQKHAVCWSRPARHEDVGIAPTFSVKREGARVAWVRGTAPAEVDPTLAALLALPRVPRPPAPPLGSFVIPPVKPAPTTAKWQPVYGGFHNATLGVTVPAYPGFAVEHHLEPLTYLMKRSGASPAFAGVELSDELWNTEARERVFRGLPKALYEVVPNADLVTVFDGPFQLPVGEGHVREWAVRGSAFGMRAVVVPICDGTGALIVSGVWGDQDGRVAMDSFLRDVRRVDKAPICDVLDP